MAGIVFGCSVPHPPLLVPEVGRGQEAGISATARSMEKLRDRLAEQHPETVLVISPHGQYHNNAMGILTAPSSSGDMSQWGVRGPSHHFDNDLEMVALIQDEAREADIPVKSIGDKSYDLDWGVMVPMHFLLPAVKGAALVPLTFSWLPLKAHFTFGQSIRRAAEKGQKRVAIIASGDLSHRLIPSAPAGYDPMGKVFDEKLVKLLSKLDSKGVLGLDEELIERAGECGLRSCVILLGALDGLKVKPEILSYEGPFGVGYLVASFQVAS
jgi:AmmeMemoRadiSam system protein B